MKMKKRICPECEKKVEPGEPHINIEYGPEIDEETGVLDFTEMKGEILRDCPECEMESWSLPLKFQMSPGYAEAYPGFQKDAQDTQNGPRVRLEALMTDVGKRIEFSELEKVTLKEVVDYLKTTEKGLAYECETIDEGEFEDALGPQGQKLLRVSVRCAVTVSTVDEEHYNYSEFDTFEFDAVSEPVDPEDVKEERA